MKSLDSFINIINNALDVALPYFILTLLLIIAGVYILKTIKKNGLSDGFYLGIIFLLEELFAIALFWFLPKYVSDSTSILWHAPALRWVEVFLFVPLVIYRLSRAHGGKRGLISSIIHLVVIYTGWLVDKWIGIMFIAIPILTIYYFLIYQFALVVVPTSEPDNKKEKIKRFLTLLSYSWGVQASTYAISNHSGRSVEQRITGGAPLLIKSPGLIWTRSHQVVGITAGTQFSRVDGPGAVFIKGIEKPLQTIDLRVQLRSSKIDVISRDGVSFKAQITSSFQINKDSCAPSVSYSSLSGEDGLRMAGSSFPYSPRQVRAAIETTRKNPTRPDTQLYWDDWALARVEEVTRQVLSQRSLDELWRPSVDEHGSNALDSIANEIKEKVEPILQPSGILIHSARVANFQFSKEKESGTDQISTQQISLWKSKGEINRSKKLSEADATAERIQQGAWAYGKSLLLTSFAESIEKALAKYPQLPRNIIAMIFLNVLQEYAGQQQSETDNDVHDTTKPSRNFSSHEPGME